MTRRNTITGSQRNKNVFRTLIKELMESISRTSGVSWF